ncbi:hypothetical protein U9M48_020811 [Paspalum notatum var. saurae]|uniref:Uncharacterized protein n=1 Tax=Paspalum notatum var. saurae TaxID=547442 RepID=A0AAQ3TH18_PASNO
MKLLVDTKAQRVLYAEAGKDVVDFLLSLLTLPVGTPLYGSVDSYVRSAAAKDALLSPAGGYDNAAANKLLRLPSSEATSSTDELYRCNTGFTSYTECRSLLTRVYGERCRRKNCGGKMTVAMRPVDSSNGSAAPASDGAGGGAGFVRAGVTYAVMDDLEVAPMSAAFSGGIDLLDTFGVTGIGMLQQKTVQLGHAEGLEILRVSLQSKTVLTDELLLPLLQLRLLLPLLLLPPRPRLGWQDDGQGRPGRRRPVFPTHTVKGFSIMPCMVEEMVKRDYTSRLVRDAFCLYCAKSFCTDVCSHHDHHRRLDLPGDVVLRLERRRGRPCVRCTGTEWWTSHMDMALGDPVHKGVDDQGRYYELLPLLSPNAKSTTLSMKLLIDIKGQRVLYAEAGKDVVDFLFSLLTLPVGTVVKILSKDAMVGSIGNLYGSVEKLDETYVRSADAKGALLAPAGGFDGGKLLQLPEPEPPAEFYRCCYDSYTQCQTYMSNVSGTRCQFNNCGGKMTRKMILVVDSSRASGGVAAAGAAAQPAGHAGGKGFVQGVVT